MEYEIIEYVERPERAEETRLREAAEAAERAYEDADAIWRDINRRYRRKIFQNPTPELRREVIAAVDARNAADHERALAWGRYDVGARWMTKTVSISEDELIRRAVEAAKASVKEDAIRALRPGGPGRWEWAHLPDDLAQQAARELSPEVGDEPSDFWIETFVSAYFTFAKRAEVSIKFPPTDQVLVEVAAERSERQASELLRPASVRSKSSSALSLGASPVEGDGPIEIETWCGTIHIDGHRCGRRLGPWSLRDGSARPSLRPVIAPKRPRQGPRPSVWHPADGPDQSEERYLQASDVSNDTYPPTCWWALCPGCKARTLVRESTMARLMREAAARGEAVLYI